MVLTVLTHLHSIFYDFAAERRRKNEINLFRFPHLIIFKVIKLMDTAEQIKLAAISNKMENWVKMARLKVAGHHIHIRETTPNIKLALCDTAIFSTPSEFNTDFKVTNRDISKWTKYEKHFENLAEIEKRLLNIFPSDNTKLYLYWPYIQTVDIRNVPFLVSTLRKCSGIIICKELNCKENFVLESTTLEFLMNAVSWETYFEIRVLDVPLDFRIENPLRFQTINYYDARWIQYEDLLSIRNHAHVTFGKTSFTNNQMNNLMKYWVDCDSDMFINFMLKLAEETELETLFEGLVVLKSFRLGYPLHYIASKPKTKKSKPILCVYCGVDVLRLTSWKTNDEGTSSHQKMVIVVKEAEILEILEEKIRLENDLEVVNEENKEDVRAELDDVEGRLKEYGVHFKDGKYVVDN